MNGLQIAITCLKHLFEQAHVKGETTLTIIFDKRSDQLRVLNTLELDRIGVDHHIASPDGTAIPVLVVAGVRIAFDNIEPRG